MTVPRIAVVGAGWWGQAHHLASLADYKACKLTAVCDLDSSRAHSAAARHGVPLVVGSVDELVSERCADGVVIATPHSTHYPLARAALLADLPVLIEKPMTLHPAHAWELVKLARERQLPLLVGYTFQYTSTAGKVRDWLHQGAIGRLLQINGTYPSNVRDLYRGNRPPSADALTAGDMSYADPAQSGGGQGQTQLSHLVGMALWASDQRVAAVCAVMDNDGLAVDISDALAVRFEGGAVGSFASTGAHRGEYAAKALFYFGTEGYIEHNLSIGYAKLARASGDTESVELREDEIPYPTGLPARALVNAIRDPGHPNLSPGEPAAHAVDVIYAAYQSARDEVSVRIPVHEERHHRG